MALISADYGASRYPSTYGTSYTPHTYTPAYSRGFVSAGRPLEREVSCNVEGEYYTADAEIIKQRAQAHVEQAEIESRNIDRAVEARNASSGMRYNSILQEIEIENEREAAAAENYLNSERERIRNQVANRSRGLEQEFEITFSNARNAAEPHLKGREYMADEMPLQIAGRPMGGYARAPVGYSPHRSVVSSGVPVSYGRPVSRVAGPSVARTYGGSYGGGYARGGYRTVVGSEVY
eukprot:NODE_1483_length_935_cov_107.224605_g1150_i0.p1 GENE.NODE_1483_length_935_cov_107.224605_g1150_i0~~NODE_1483_length_935_cov_107.224605_g1150_i0.p1  ORF type:complete len:256 (-),score=63.24 NODE_1483_length_935_cov_107.224605_g1150_i0:168-875(-)